MALQNSRAIHFHRAWIVAAALALPAAARAGNDNELSIGNRAATMGSAVVSTVDDPSATWWNPAGLGAIERDQFDVSGSFYTLRFYKADDFINTRDGDSEDASVTEFIAVPTQIAYVVQLGRGVTLGLGYFVSNAGNYLLREELRTGNRTQGSAWQLMLSGRFTLQTGAAAIGFQLSPYVRLGASLVGSYASEQQALSFFGLLRSDGMTRALTTSSALITASQWGLEIGAGAQFDLGPQVKFGIAMRSPRLRLIDSTQLDANNADGSAEADADPSLDGTAMQRDLGADGVGWARAGRLTVGGSYAYGAGWIAAEVELEPGLHSDTADRKLVVNARAGVHHELSRHFALGAGIFSDRTAESGELGLASGRGDFYGGTLGLEIGKLHLLAADEPAESIILSTVFAVRYAFSSGYIGGLRVDADSARMDSVGLSRGDLTVHELGLYFGSGLQF